MPFNREKLEEWNKREVSAVFDSSPLIYLTRIGILDDALKVYKECYMPEGVKIEVIDKGAELHKPDALILAEYVRNKRIQVRKIKSLELYTKLLENPHVHEADIEAICLAEELRSILVMDDPKAIEIANSRGIDVEPTLTVILVCYCLDYINFRRAENSYKTLLKTQFRVKAEVYDTALEFLRLAREKKEFKR